MFMHTHFVYAYQHWVPERLRMVPPVIFIIFKDGFGKSANIGAWLSLQHSTHVDHADIQGLPVETVINEVNAAATDMTNYVSTIGALSVPLDMQFHRAEVLKLKKVFDVKQHEALDYKAQFDKISTRELKDAEAEKTKKKNLVAKYVERLTDDQVPNCLAHAIGGIVAMMDPDASEPPSASSAPFPTEFSLEKDHSVPEEVLSYFESVRSFMTVSDEACKNVQLSYWHEELRRVCKATVGAVPRQTIEMMKVVSLTKHAVAGVSCLTTPRDFRWNPPMAIEIFNHGDQDLGKAIIHVLLPNTIAFNRLNNPWVSLGGIIMATEGTIVMAILSREQVLAMGGGDIAVYLKSLPSSALAKNPVFMISPGMAVYWPVGNYPVVYGFKGSNEDTPQLLSDKRHLKKDSKKGLSMAGHCSYLYFPDFDVNHRKNLCTGIVSNINANLVLSSSVIPPSVKKWTVFQRYRDAMSKEEEEDEDKAAFLKSAEDGDNAQGGD